MSDKKQAAVFIADGCEEIEALTVADLCFRAGIPLKKISVSDRAEVTSSHEITFRCDSVIADEDLDEYDMLILPGGIPGTMNLKACKKLEDGILAHAARADRAVAAICAAPSILSDLGLLKGRNAACNPSWEEKVAAGGANILRENAVADGNIITSRGMGTSISFGLAIAAWFLGGEKAAALGRKIVYGPCLE